MFCIMYSNFRIVLMMSIMIVVRVGVFFKCNIIYSIRVEKRYNEIKYILDG